MNELKKVYDHINYSKYIKFEPKNNTELRKWMINTILYAINIIKIKDKH